MSSRSSDEFLSALDSPNFSYPGWEADKSAAECAYTDSGSFISLHAATSKLEAMRVKQRIFEGRRSSIPELERLDNAVFTYEYWEEDKKKAERVLIDDGLTSFKSALNLMKRKQAMHANRSSDEFLCALDSPNFSYPGWEADKSAAECTYTECGSFFSLHMATSKLEGMKVKQRLFDGRRSSIPELGQLDSAVFTYEGWKEDKKTAERVLIADGLTSFKSAFNLMKRKQAMHANRSSDEFLCALDSPNFSYPGWEVDKSAAECTYTECGSCISLHMAKSKLEAMKVKQRLFEGRRSSIRGLARLDSEVFTYEGWEADKERAERVLIGDGLTSFESAFNLMKRKQAIQVDGSSEAVPMEIDSVEPKPIIPSPRTTKAPERTQGEGTLMCAICWDCEPSHAYIPCGHCCVCANCASRVMDKGRGGGLKCPLCRGDAILLTQIFM